MIVMTNDGKQHIYKSPNDSVIEPSLLDMLPPPADCNEGQRKIAIGWYMAQPLDKLGEYMGNTQQRIYREFYNNPRKRRVGRNLYNLYAMRDMISEAMRRKGAKVFGRTQTAATTEFEPNYVSLDKIDAIRASRTGTSS